MKRSYESIIRDHFNEHSQIAMLSGPRQVGKTTLAQSLLKADQTVYLNWDDFDDRALILKGGRAIADFMGLDQLRDYKPLLIFDEIHKYGQWKQMLKGFFDRYKDQCKILVTGSARMDVYKKGGDSLMGRYFNYRLHPFSVAEVLKGARQLLPGSDIVYQPQVLPAGDYDALLQWGGFPEPFIKQNQRFFNRWSRLRDQQLLQEDIRELTRVQELGQLEILAILLKSQSGQLTSYSNLAKKVRVSVDTIRRWTVILESLYYCFAIRPWTKNVTRSLLKEPKYYLWDWSQCTDIGARNENFIASHLLKAVHAWTDRGMGEYQLHFLRDKEKREVDFLVSRNNKPWMMVEVKSSIQNKLSPHLQVFAKQLGVQHVFQLGVEGDYIDADVFTIGRPIVVPAKTFLSQLV